MAGFALAALPPAQAAGAPAPAPVKAEAEPQGLLNLGAALTKRGEYDTAEIAFWQILNGPDVMLADKKSALLGLAHLHRRKGELTKATAIYEKYVKDYPDDERVPDALLELGRALRDLGVYRMAISSFYSVINSTLKYPSHAFEHYEVLAKTAQFEIAQTHFEAGEYAEAGKFFSRVRLLELAPSDRARAHFMAAFAEQLGGDLETAVVTLHSFLEEWPDDRNVPEARYLLATTLRQLGRPQEALVVTFDLMKEEHARVADGSSSWSYWQRRTGNQVANEFFQNGDTLNALAIYQCLAKLSDDPSWSMPVTYQIALCFERLRQLDQARAAYQTIVAAAAARTGPPATPEVAELGRMASWRLTHLEWRDETEHRISAFFPAIAKPSPAPAPPSVSPHSS